MSDFECRSQMVISRDPELKKNIFPNTTSGSKLLQPGKRDPVFSPEIPQLVKDALVPKLF